MLFLLSVEQCFMGVALERTLFLCLSACLGITHMFGYVPSRLLQEAAVKLEVNTRLRCCLQFLEMEWLGQMVVSFEK